MEELLPTLQTDLLPKLKGRKNERKRAWFGVSDNVALQLCCQNERSHLFIFLGHLVLF